MKFITIFLTSLSLLSSLSIATPAASPKAQPHLEKRGPSGHLNYPSGGTVFQNHKGESKFSVSYQQVHQSNAQTDSINVSLESVGGSETAWTSGTNLASTSETGAITGDFSPPADTCGEYRVVIGEWQFYNGQHIFFKSAAPLVTFHCT